MNQKHKRTKRLKIFNLLVWCLPAILMGCGNSNNSRMFPTVDGSITGGIIANPLCTKGCYGIPQSWYDNGIVVTASGVKKKLDPTVNFYGACSFKVCPDNTDPIHKDAKEYIATYGGTLIEDSTQCGLFTTMQFAEESIGKGSGNSNFSMVGGVKSFSSTLAINLELSSLQPNGNIDGCESE